MSSPLSSDQIHFILDVARPGDMITVTRSNSGDLSATVTGPCLADPPGKAVGIDLLDGEPHVIRREDGQVFGRIVDLRVTIGGPPPHERGSTPQARTTPHSATTEGA